MSPLCTPQRRLGERCKRREMTYGLRVSFVGFAILWVAGWGTLFSVYPVLACRIFRRPLTETNRRLARAIGAVELTLAIFGVVGVLILRITPLKECPIQVLGAAECT